MTNLPPPDPRSSRLGFDELIGIVVAFAVIGTILVVSLRQKDKGFGIGTLVPSLTTTPASPDATASPTPTQLEEDTPLPSPAAQAPETPVSPTVTLKQQPRATPFVVAAPVAPAPAQSPSPSPVPVKRFSDVPQDLWARPYIEALTQREIIAGYEDGTFRPGEPVTRAAFAAQLNKAFGETAVAGVPGYTPDYKDVPDKFWALSAIKETSRKGFLRGFPGDVFRPQQEISKLQALLALNSGLNLPAASAPGQVVQIYQDADQIPKYATNAVAAATQAGIVVNHPNPQQLRPQILLTRAEVAALIHQALAKAGKVEAIPSQYVVTPK